MTEPGGSAAEPDPGRARLRRAGLLLHPTCLPGPGPIGDLGPAAHALLAWLAEAGLSRWQVLPLGPTGFGDSPYGALSSFAGNPLLVSPERLVASGLARADELTPSPHVSASATAAVDFAAAHAARQRLHRKVWASFAARASKELSLQWQAFRDDEPTRLWLADWSAYAALKSSLAGRPWPEWDPELRDRESAALARAGHALAAEFEFHAFEQFLFASQWGELRAAAAARGVGLIGDLPIYPALDSADVWAARELFALAPSGRPKAVAGVPPDYFSASGQLWGNPLYRWDRLAETGYAWWRARIRRQHELFDELRLDHFRGFVSYWSVSPRAKTAARGRWLPGPGKALFDAVAGELGALPLLAEDLGQIDDAVHSLRRELALPGMRVLQFGFDEADSLHAPHRHTDDCAVYTGTHDNDTSRGWYEKAAEQVRHRVRRYLGTSAEDLPWAMVRAALTSPGELAVVPMQDLLALGSEARLNTPGRESGNWRWRVRAEQVPGGLAARVRDLADAAARRPPAPPARD